jgi:hypothetical protein
MNKAVAFLQNAWSPLYAGDHWPRRSWLQALHRSRSGLRLKNLTNACPNVEVYFDNTTPEVGGSPDSILPADLNHIQKVVNREMPDYIVTLGKQAKTVIKSIYADKYPLLLLPHPAYRLVSNDLFFKAGHLLSEGFSGIIELVQIKGSIIRL